MTDADRRGTAPGVLRLLILEDEHNDVTLEIAALTAAGYECEWDHVDTREAFLESIATSDYDLILSDYALPGFDGLEALRLMLERGIDVPFIMVSGTMGEDAAIESIKAGATDYVLKARLTRLVPVVRRALAEREEHRRRQEAEEELQKSATHLHALIRTIPDLVWLKSPDGVYLACNPAFESFFGASEADVVGKTDYDFQDREIADFFRAHDRAAVEAGGPSMNEEELTFASDGHVESVETIKTPMYDPDGNLVGVLGVARDITARKRAQEALRESEERFRRALANIPDVVVIYDADLRIRYVNSATTTVSGRDPEEFIGKREEDLWPIEVCGTYMPTLRKARDTGTPQSVDVDVRLSVGDLQHLHITCVPLLDAGGNVREILGITHDFSEREHAEEVRVKLESQFQQAQKMEAVGRLAGGVAHDFNNILSVIMGYTELAMLKLPPADPLHADLVQVLSAARRSTELTRQLLAFARRQTITPEVLDLNGSVSGLLKMLQRLIGEDITLDWRPASESCAVRMDPSQVDQLIANLAVNARDAIDGVGAVSISTEIVVHEGPVCEDELDLTPGEYVVLKFRDTGSGMDEETLAHIFEPFFSTKAVGEGTGLGLATVYGIVRQSGGYITVESEPGHGAEFRIGLPRLNDELVAAAADVAAVPPRRGTETVLLVEDERAILGLAKRMLEQLGYTVLIAGTPLEAIRVAGENAGSIGLVLTDVVMPEMNGRQLVERLKSIIPEAKYVYMSGYAANVIAHRGVLEDDAMLLRKPFSIAELANIVRDALV